MDTPEHEPEPPDSGAIETTVSEYQPPDRHSYAKGQSVPGAGNFGMALFIASLGMLFAASIVAYLVIWSRAETWPPPGMPAFPQGLWFSTVVLLLSSGSMAWALHGARNDEPGALRFGMLVTAQLGALFLVSQIVNWWQLVSVNMIPAANLYGFLFYVLTGLHGLHVIGGLIPLSVVTVRAFQGRYSSSYHPGVRYCSYYWHFLDIVWVILFALLLLTT